MTLPTVHYFGLGGTISSIRSHGPGASPTLTAADIAASVPGLREVARLHAHPTVPVPSPALTVANLMELVDQMRAAALAGADGFVVTQGTDTMEEAAFVVDLLWDRPEPVVFSGAMRNPSLPGADGPANLLAAVQVAADPVARGLGVVTCLNDEIHAARFVHKSHTSSPSTFVSPGLGPIGWVSEGRVVIALEPRFRYHLPIVEAPQKLVAMIWFGLDDDCAQLATICSAGYHGLVLAGLGGGHVPPAALGYLDDLVVTMPVVLTSRTGAGEVLASTYQFPGSELDLLGRGLIRAGMLAPAKARLLLMLCLSGGYEINEIADAFAIVGCTSGPTDRRAPKECRG